MIHKMPKYPIYIPSKGRAFQVATSMRMFARAGIPHYLVVEEQEALDYELRYPDSTILVLPFSNLGSGVYARQWIREHSRANGDERHWQFDDNIDHFARKFKGLRIRCATSVAICWAEHFTDRFENIGISGINYEGYIDGTERPVTLNGRVYSMMLYNNACPVEYRTKYNEDADNCLQAIAQGWCTINVNIFGGDKETSMINKGGNTAALYSDGGRIKFAKSLEYLWPGIVKTGWRHGHVQHMVYKSWKAFAIAGPQLKLKPEWEGVELPNAESFMKLSYTGKRRSNVMDDLVRQYAELSGNDPGQGKVKSANGSIPKATLRSAQPLQAPRETKSGPKALFQQRKATRDYKYTPRGDQQDMFASENPNAYRDWD